MDESLAVLAEVETLKTKKKEAEVSCVDCLYASTLHRILDTVKPLKNVPMK